MDKFIKSNALISLAANLVINTLIPFFILWNNDVVYLKEGSAILMPNILAAVTFSSLATTLITFFLMTKKRESGEIDLPIRSNTKWFPKALFEGLIIAILLALIAFGILLLIQSKLENIEIRKVTVLIISSLVGGFTGFITAFIAANRASKIK